MWVDLSLGERLNELNEMISKASSGKNLRTFLINEAPGVLFARKPHILSMRMYTPDRNMGVLWGCLCPLIVANIYTEEVERKALDAYKGDALSHWFRYVDNTWLKIKGHEIGCYTHHFNSVAESIKFTGEEMRGSQLPLFLDSGIKVEKEGILKVEVYWKSTHTNQCLHVWLIVHWSRNKERSVPYNWTEAVSTHSEAGEKEHTLIKQACGYLDSAFIRTQEDISAIRKRGSQGLNNRHSMCSWSSWKVLKGFLQAQHPFLFSTFKHWDSVRSGFVIVSRTTL